MSLTTQLAIATAMVATTVLIHLVGLAGLLAIRGATVTHCSCSSLLL